MVLLDNGEAKNYKKVFGKENKMDYAYLADVLLSYMINWRGVQETIIYLMDCKFTKEELRELGFSKEDIDYVIGLLNITKVR